MRYDVLRDVVAKRKPGWEHLQEVRNFFVNRNFFIEIYWTSYQYEFCICLKFV